MSIYCTYVPKIHLNLSRFSSQPSDFSGPRVNKRTTISESFFFCVNILYSMRREQGAPAGTVLNRA